MTIGPVQQSWVCELPFMQQAVLMSAVRAPDGIPKNHPVKVLMRWYRRCVLIAAFERKALTDPFEPGGGSFTGPFECIHARQLGLISHEADWYRGRWKAIDQMRDLYLDHVDELPHHFQLHFMHAAQILGVHHPEWSSWWKSFYLMIVEDAHLQPETDDAMNLRLSDNRSEWLAREVRTAT